MSTPTLARGPQHDNKPFLQEKIRRRDYELYVQRGSQPGSELADWLRAEEEILRAEDAAIDEASRGVFSSQ